jgi:23S rRNA (uracil1939-C5)-methyltransferase
MSRKQKKRKIARHLEIMGIHPSGKGWTLFQGRKVFIPNTITGEIISGEIVYGGSEFLSGNLIEIEKPHPYRQEPVCKHFKLCGGCLWQHIQYPYQLQLKSQILDEALNYKGIPFKEIKPIIPSENEFFYRNQLTFSFSSQRWFYDEEGKIDDAKERLAVGFNVAQLSNRIVDITECYLQPEPSVSIARQAKKIAQDLNISFFNFKNGSGTLRTLEILQDSTQNVIVMIGFASQPDEAAFRFLEHLLTNMPGVKSVFWKVYSNPFKAFGEMEVHCFDGKDRLLRINNIDGFSFRVSPQSFFQTNRFIAPKLFRYVMQKAEVKTDDTVYDLYCGTGILGIFLAKQAKKVIGIEFSPAAVEDAKENAILNGVHNCTFVQGDVLSTLTLDFIKKYGHPNVVILDPPRSGTLIEIKKILLSESPEKIIYVSCNPQALARDLQMLISKYEIEEIQPIDMFPQTPHIESVVVLSLKK